MSVARDDHLKRSSKSGFVARWIETGVQKELKERYIDHLQGENKNLTISNKRPCGPKRDDERKTKVRKERSKRSDKSTTERGQVIGSEKRTQRRERGLEKGEGKCDDCARRTAGGHWDDWNDWSELERGRKAPAWVWSEEGRRALSPGGSHGPDGLVTKHASESRPTTAATILLTAQRARTPCWVSFVIRV